MKQALRRIARSGVNYARHSRLAYWLRESEPSKIQQSAEREVFAHFTDSRREEYQLIKGYRDRIKPDWQTMFDPPIQSLSESEKTALPAGARRSIEECLRALSASGVKTKGSEKVLEIGCYMGNRAYALAAYGGFRVTAIDLPEYYVQQTSGLSIDEASLKEEAARLDRLRQSMRTAFELAGAESSSLDRVTFLEEDISATSFPSDSFDAIVSWEVLEHIRDPQQAFREMFRLLKPSGFTFHDYNPFFCIQGGHSLCTLDFPYGHARLSAEDFASCVRRFRPQEAEVDLRFFHNNLNRMTLRDLRRMCDESGFETISIIEWPTPGDIAEINTETLRQVRANYPGATLNDLLMRRVWVILRKPE